MGGNYAIIAEGFSGAANLSPVGDEAMVGYRPDLGREQQAEILLHFKGVASSCQPHSTAYSRHMGIDGKGRYMENGAENYTGRLAADSREAFQFISTIRNLSSVFFQKNPAAFHNLTAFLPIKAQAFYLTFQERKPHFQNISRSLNP